MEGSPIFLSAFDFLIISRGTWYLERALGLFCGLSCVRFVSYGKVFKKPQTEPQGFATIRRFLSRNDGDSTNEMRDGAVSFSCPDYLTFSEFQTCFRLWLQRSFSVCSNLVVGSGRWSLLHQDNKGVCFFGHSWAYPVWQIPTFSSIVTSNKFFCNYYLTAVWCTHTDIPSEITLLPRCPPSSPSLCGF